MTKAVGMTTDPREIAAQRSGAMQAFGAEMRREHMRRHLKPGYWLVQLVRGGPYVPACISVVHTTSEPGEPDNVMERSPFLAGFICGEPASLAEIFFAKGEAITEADYRYHTDNQRWARDYAPHEAIARPRRPVDWFHQPPPF